MRLLFSLGVLAASLGGLQTIESQIKASERGSTGQIVDGTTVLIDYSRPQARGREIFGALVPFGTIWTPGADFASNVSFDKPVKINGVEIEAGSYSIWTLPGEEVWEINFHPDPRIFHTRIPNDDEYAYTVMVTPEPAEHVEVMTFVFDEVRTTGTTLSLRWADTRISIPIEVFPSGVDERERPSR